jgi:hypothetical protein
MKKLFLPGLLALGISFVSGCCDKSSDHGGGKSLNLILAQGGAGQAGIGGAGGQVSLEAGATTGGGITVRAAGAADVSLTLPAPPVCYLGANPWTVTANYTLNVYFDQADADANAANGEYLLMFDNSTLWHRTGPAAYDTVTGLQVNSGVTLTLGLNIDYSPLWFGETIEDTAGLQFVNDVVIYGALKAKSLDTAHWGGATLEQRGGGPATSLDKGAIVITCDRFFLYGAISNSGLNATTMNQRGGYGGMVNIHANSIFTSGVIDVSGGNGLGTGDGGGAGWQDALAAGVVLSTELGGLEQIVNTATIKSNGGTGANGGNSGLVLFSSFFGDIYNTGSLYSVGGKGTNGNGGFAGGPFGYSIVSGSWGSVYNRGPLNVIGGDAVENGIGGPVFGGDCAQVQLDTGPGVYNSGAILGQGGRAFGDGNGGAGPGVLLRASDPAGVINSQAVIMSMGGAGAGAGNQGGPGGTVSVSAGSTVNIGGSMFLSGGAGDDGGPAGGLTVTSQGNIALLGYKGGIKVDGGAGAVGGLGGSVHALAGLNLAVQVPVAGSGGRGLDGDGGGGGVYILESNMGSISHLGNVSMNGGNAINGHGGVSMIGLFFSALDTIEVGGVLDFNGGSATGAGDFKGGWGGLATISAGNNITLSGTYRAAGGSGVYAGTGGSGGFFSANTTNQTISRMSFHIPGGAADLYFGSGGKGGILDLNSGNPPATDHVGDWNVNGGAGNVPGLAGYVYIDGVQVYP